MLGDTFGAERVVCHDHVRSPGLSDSLPELWLRYQAGQPQVGFIRGPRRWLVIHLLIYPCR